MALKPIVRALSRAALPCLLAGASLGAEPPPGDEMILFQDIPSVFAASNYLQKVTEAPASVSIVTDDDIRKYGYRTLADILRSLRGFYISYDRNYSFVGARGFSRPGDYNSRVLLLVDGHRVNDNIYSQGLIGTEFPLDVDLIERVEVVRGPGSSLYGTSAFFAVINVITKRASHIKGVELSGELGSQSTHKARASFGKRFDNGLELMLSATGFHSRGQRSLYFEEFDTPENNYGNARDRDGDGGESLFANLTFGDFNLQFVNGSRTKQVPTASFGTAFNDQREHTVDTRQYLDLKYQHLLNPDSEITARVFLDYYRYHADYPYDDPPTLNHDSLDGRSWGAQSQYSTRLGANHRLIAGAEYIQNYRQWQQNADVSPAVTYLDSKARSKTWAAYVQDEVAISRSLTLNIGGRYDRLVDAHSANPRLGLIYNPTNDTSVKLLYGTAFRAPNAYELYYHAESADFKPSVGLKPEQIRTSSIVLEHEIAPQLRGLATVYRNDISDLISLHTDPADGKLVIDNLDRVRARGFELELDGHWDNGIEGKLSFTYQDTRNADTGETLSNSPGHLAKLNLSVPVARAGLSAGLEVQYVSPRRTVQDTTLPGYVVSNLTLLSRAWRNGMELSASIYNLFDRKFADPGSDEHQQAGIFQDGRTLRVKLTYPF